MRFVKRLESSPASRGRTPHIPRAKPQWLREWIEDQGRWGLLKCGCKLNITARGLTIIEAFGGKKAVTIFCERHNEFYELVRLMKFTEYAGITVTAIPDIPAF